MRRRNKTMIAIGLFLIGLLGLWGCGSPSSDYTDIAESATEAAYVTDVILFESKQWKFENWKGDG